MKYFIIGERELILAFGLVGVKGITVSNREEALNAFYKVTGADVSVTSTPLSEERPNVLILTEEVSSMLEDEVLDWQMQNKYPLIVEIPGLQGHLEGKKTLTDAIREAIGIHI